MGTMTGSSERPVEAHPMVKASTLVVGLGNPLLGDDGVGWRIAEQVRQAVDNVASTVEVDFLAVGGLSLMERLVGYDRAILIDAITTGQQSPGSVYRFSIDDLPDVSGGHLSSAHDATLPTALKAGRAVGLSLPREVTIVAVEAAHVYDFSETLTVPVAAAVSPATRMVLDLLEGGAMVSPELLRRYPFFGFLDDSQLRAVAMIAEEITFERGDMILESGKPADSLYFLIEGSAELCYVVADPYSSELRKELFISDLNPGEIFGISALIDPYLYTGTMRATGPCRVIQLQAAALRAICEVDPQMAYGLMRQTAKTAMSRLHDTRVQLAAARA